MYRSIMALAWLAVAAFLVTAPDGEAQDLGAAWIPVQRPVYNPYTGASRQAPTGPNPFTGQNAAAPPPMNPFMGNQGQPPADYNPYTGRYVPRAQRFTVPGEWGRQVPVTGLAGSGLEHVDAVMLGILEKYAIPGAALAIAKDGKLVLAKGYGWANLQTGAPIQPDMLLGLASLSKPITALTILKLIDDGKLRLDDRAFKVLAHIQPPAGARVDPRIYTITVRQLLEHAGGWDRNVSGEPCSFSWKVSRQLRVPLPITADQLIAYMMTQPLDFEPGTKVEYCNFGYVVLGQIIERLSGQPYEEYVQKRTLAPMGIRRAQLPGPQRTYHRDEALRYLQGTDQVFPPTQFPAVGDAAGGWSASAVDMARFLTALDGSRTKAFLSDEMYKMMLAPPPPPLKTWANGTHVGLGWLAVSNTPRGPGYWQDGLLPGSRTFMGRFPGGVNWVVLFNSGESLTPRDLEVAFAARREMAQPVQQTRIWPKVDYFSKYP